MFHIHQKKTEMNGQIAIDAKKGHDCFQALKVAHIIGHQLTITSPVATFLCLVPLG
jgi:hypothetical protein